METATVVLPLLASLLTAVLVAMAQWVLLVPRIEERLQALKEDIGELKTQLANQIKDAREQFKACEAERKRHEDELYNKANQNAKDIAVLKQARNHGYVTD